jgi:hypothetical protein
MRVLFSEFPSQYRHKSSGDDPTLSDRSILEGSFHLETGSKEAERLDAVLQKYLAKDRESRFSSAVEMQRELIPAIREYPLFDTQQWSSSEADTLLY